MGPWELKKMLNSLFQFSERLYSGCVFFVHAHNCANAQLFRSQDQMDDTILHLSSFINSFANILLELNDFEDSYLDHLETILGTFFIIFPQLYSVQREKYYLAISRLFISLYSKTSALRSLLSRVGTQNLFQFLNFANIC